MDLRALRYFVATAEELNITRAAEKLHMSQPPLSHQLHLLEEELGTPLFLRGHRRLQLTPEGELLLRRARQLLELEEKTRGEIRQVQQSLSGRLFLCRSRADSLRIMKRNALTREGEAPVANV